MRAEIFGTLIQLARAWFSTSAATSSGLSPQSSISAERFMY
jgi:hypothetical protein